MKSQYDVVIKPYDSTYVKLCVYDDDLIYDIWKRYSFYVDGYKFMPKYKAGIWDGQIHLFDRESGLFPYGLIKDLAKYLVSSDYTVKIDDGVILKSDIDIDEIVEFCEDELSLPFEPKDYQIESVYECVKTGRKLIESATGSGKSFTIYLLIQWLLQKEELERGLLVVPVVNLRQQMKEDFRTYSEMYNGFDVDKDVYIIPDDIKSGRSMKDAKVVITTWQSVYKKKSNFFNDNFDFLIVDEVHTFKGEQVKKIAEMSNDIWVKCGFSGTIANSKTDEMQLIAMFGDVYKAANTADLIKSGVLSDLKIKCLEFEHKGVPAKIKYHDEIDMIVNSSKRNKTIATIASKLNGATLVLFSHITQGEALYELLKDSGKKVMMSTGRTDVKERERIRQIASENDDVIILATYQVFQAGINIPRLKYLLLASPTKSSIRLLQSIGRILRKHESKDTAVVLDFYDDMSGGRKWKNATLKHFLERYSIYEDSGFDVDVARAGVIEWK